ncbi:hypothetical protein F4695_004568 [Rhizobium soli]|uniref:Uncharacterized protein n=1 Tax=Rhizobium soli TaxID=424798 RepID=A0A7X0JPV9_9HYPH|nr:hypothetical protein [Rhizobium soli]MBB6511170.1 hypothetical protein [Rhizobium soli]
MSRRGSPGNAEIFGLPNWRDKTAYSWELTDVDRWKWEFTRRRPEIRAAFDRYKQITHECNLISDPTETMTPEDPDFWAIVTPGDETYGLEGIPNPAISGALYLESVFKSTEVKVEVGDIAELEDVIHAKSRQFLSYQAFVVIDRRKPLESQLDEARVKLRAVMFQRSRRDRSGAWSQHLRILDAVETGATNDEIARVFFPGTREGRQAVSKALRAAKEVRDNLPS